VCPTRDGLGAHRWPPGSSLLWAGCDSATHWASRQAAGLATWLCLSLRLSRQPRYMERPGGASMLQLHLGTILLITPATLPDTLLAQWCCFPACLLHAGFPPGHLFHGRLIPQRMSTSWGHISLIAAERLLLQEALKDPQNDRQAGCVRLRQDAPWGSRIPCLPYHAGRGTELASRGCCQGLQLSRPCMASPHPIPASLPPCLPANSQHPNPHQTRPTLQVSADQRQWHPSL